MSFILFHLSYNAYVSLVVCYSFKKESRSFYKLFLFRKMEETVTLLRETEIYVLFCSSLCKASAEQTHQKAAE